MQQLSHFMCFYNDNKLWFLVTLLERYSFFYNTRFLSLFY